MSPEEPRRGKEVPAYAATRLIAYIGNKRALLPFLSEIFLELEEEAAIRSFLDPFAGSGAVSRLARSLGWSVMANDAEEYSRAVNEAWLGVSADELPLLFAAEGGLAAVLARLNGLHPSRGDASPACAAVPYIARHYAPAATADPDWRRERLFYTRENAVFLDRARCAIEELRPAAPARSVRAERAVLLGPLVYEAATHANTSGVFKAYHKGFGGHGLDALGRILSPMFLEPPLLWPGPPAEVSRGDAASFCASRAADLCYLDPPYNQHQYGSNYHILNTIARWDRQPVSEARSPDGSLLSAAGIPSSWIESRSAFCSKRTAGAAFRSLLSAVDARTILLSYNTEGFVEAEELVEMLSDRAEVSLRSVDYVKYRGGRQSASRRNGNREILFVARRRVSHGIPSRPEPVPNAQPAAPPSMRVQMAPSSMSAQTAKELRKLRVDVRLARAMSGPFEPAGFRDLCGGGERLAFRSSDGSIELRSFRGLVLEPGSGDVAARLGTDAKEKLAELLEPLLLSDNAAACEGATALIEAGDYEKKIQDLALAWLRKLAYRSYGEAFRGLAGRLAAAAVSRPDRLTRLGNKVAEIETLFGSRMAEARRYRGVADEAS